MSVAGGGLVWLARVVFLPGVKQQVEEMLHDKFAEAKLDMEERHAQNRKELEQLRKAWEESAEDRKALREKLAELVGELNYLRGKESGKFQRPPQ